MDHEVREPVVQPGSRRPGVEKSEGNEERNVGAQTCMHEFLLIFLLLSRYARTVTFISFSFALSGCGISGTVQHIRETSGGTEEGRGSRSSGLSLALQLRLGLAIGRTRRSLL